MGRLNIYDRRERALVTAADAALWPVALTRRAFRWTSASTLQRILCLRLERIGDLLMTLPALAELRARAPHATIDLVVGSWNRELAAAMPGVDRVETLDAAWLARPGADGRGSGGLGPMGLLSAARAWRPRHYDLAINFEPDIRSNLLLAASGARRLAGYASGGGGALLDVALDYDVRAHTADNAVRLVRHALGSDPADRNRTAGSDPGRAVTHRDDLNRVGSDPGRPITHRGDRNRAMGSDPGRPVTHRCVSDVVGSDPGDRNRTMGSDPGRAVTLRLDPGRAVTLRLPPDAIAAATDMLARLPAGPRVGVHVSGGRPVKQWPESRFADVAARLIADRNATIVLTGAPGDRAQVDRVKEALPPERVLDVAGGMDLVALAALLSQLDLFVTGDTGPMHLAHAVGTPIVAVFGPSDPLRYAPRGPRDRVVRIDLPCSPCNRIRLPPARCTGHSPDCLTGIDAARVLHAIDEVLGA